MEDEKQNGGVVNHFEAGSNCQVFNGDVRGCVFAMPGATVTQQCAEPAAEPGGEQAPGQACADDVGRNEELFHFIHPAIDSEEAEWQIHHEIERLVTKQGIQEVCQYLKKMADEKRILLPQNAEKVYNELVRMGMPNGEGYSLKTFRNCYVR